LRKKGFLQETDRQSARAFVPTKLALGFTSTPDEGDPNTYVIPCLGSVPAGNPIEALEEQIGTLRMSISMLPKPQPRADELFALQANGESMVGAGILNGDWLVVRVQNDAPKESIVVARVEGDVTVKRLLRDGKGWFLQPENPAFQPIHITENPFEIVGQVVALQRNLA
jgi:repressor LexA